MARYIDFKQVSQDIKFKTLLDHLNIPYKEEKDTIKTDDIVVTISKNQFFFKNTKKGGSVINYLASVKEFDLRQSAEYLVKTFLSPPTEPKKPIPVLTLNHSEWLTENNISEEMATEYEIGKPQGKSVLSGSIVFRVYYEDGSPAGYVGFNPQKGWIFPKGSKRGNIVYNLHRVTTEYCILVSDILDCLHLIRIGYPFTIALMAEHATDFQIDQIGHFFKRVLVIHKNPDNICQRLMGLCFVKAISCNSARNLSNEDVKAFFR